MDRLNQQQQQQQQPPTIQLQQQQPQTLQLQQQAIQAQPQTLQAQAAALQSQQHPGQAAATQQQATRLAVPAMAVSVPVSVHQAPQPIMATGSNLRSATPLPQLQVLPGGIHPQAAYLQQLTPFNHQQQLMLQSVQAAMQNQLNMIQQGRAQNANNAAALLSPNSTHLTPAQAAQLAAVANSNNNLASVSMAVPISTAATKPPLNSGKNQTPGQGQQQGQVQTMQSQAQTTSGAQTLVAGKPAMLPQQSGTPLMLGQITNVFSQAGSVAPTFVSQPQLMTQTGQIISSQNLLSNQLLAMAAGFNPQAQVWGLTNTGQLVPQAMLDGTAMQGGNAPQGMQLAAAQPLLTSAGQSPAFLSQGLFLRPMHTTQQVPGVMTAATAMPAGFTLKGPAGKVQIEPNNLHQHQQQQQQLKAVAMGMATKQGQTAGPVSSKTILPSTSRSPMTAKIQPNMVTAASQAGQGSRLNIPQVIPKPKPPRTRVAKVTATTTTSAIPVSIPLVFSSAGAVLPGKVVAATSTANSASSSPSKPGTPVSLSLPVTTVAVTTISAGTSTVASSLKAMPQQEQIESNKKVPVSVSVLPTPSLPTSIVSSPAPLPPAPSTLVKPDPPPLTKPLTAQASQDSNSASLSIIIDSKEDVKKREEEEEMEVETPDKPPVTIEAPPPLITPVTSMSILSPMTLSLSPVMGEKQRAIVKPQIITHIIDGFIIQEGPVPFPVQRSSLLTEFVPPKPAAIVEKQSEDDAAEYDDQPPPLLSQSQAHFSGTGEDMQKCEYCGKLSPSAVFRSSGRFCTNTCSKRYSVAFSKHVLKHKGSGTKFAAKKKLSLGAKKGWRTGHGGRLAYNINPPAGGMELSSSNSGQETSSSAASPVAGPDFDMDTDSQGGPQTSDPAKWNVMDVYEFVKHLPGCQEYADEFRCQEIDGQALLLLKEDHLMSAMSIKLGPALKICARINALREEALNSANVAPAAPNS